MRIFPSKADFDELAETHRLIPVWTQLSADTLTPISLYYQLVGEKRGFLLESSEQGKCGRYSIIGCDPFACISVHKSYTEVHREQVKQRIDGKPLTALEEILSPYSCEKIVGLPPIAGGAVGYFAYEIASTWERIRNMAVDEETILAELMLCEIVAVFDNFTHTVFLINWQEVPDTKASEAYDNAVVRLKELISFLEQQQIPSTNSICKHSSPLQCSSNVTKPDFIAQIEQAKEYIGAGDAFQVVLSQKFNFEPVTEPFDLFRQLRRLNPSPYMFYIDYGQRVIFGASPERLIKLEEGKIFSYPIAGTRPRSQTDAEDEILADELLDDEKERAEHSMLVDLARNDVGRVSQPGTVLVERFMEVEKFSHVMHLVSEVTGQIQPGLSALDVFAAAFPAGTVSGAPKARAMEIIAELEGQERGIYAGAVGYLDFYGGLDTCIAIRTVVVDGNKAVVQAGAGIVFDSIPEKEFEETCHKAKVLRQLILEDGHDTDNR